MVRVMTALDQLTVQANSCWGRFGGVGAAGGREGAVVGLEAPFSPRSLVHQATWETHRLQGFKSCCCLDGPWERKGKLVWTGGRI